MILILQLVPTVEPENFGPWLWIVGGGAVIGFFVWLFLRSRGHNLRCLHEFEAFDTTANLTLYRCRKCGLKRGHTRLASPAPTSYPDTDYEWFAVDATGRVAVFTTAGYGPVPAAVLAAMGSTDAFSEAMFTLPTRGGATMLVTLPDPGDYVHFASRGFYAYDWGDSYSREYKQLARPDRPIHISELPEKFQALLRRTAFAKADFADSRTLDVRAEFECEPRT